MAGYGNVFVAGYLPESDFKMSYILDALKKVENEKAKKNRSSGMVSISGELFRDEQQAVSSGGSWKILSVMVAVSLLTFIGTWFFISGKNQSSKIAKVQQPLPTKILSPQALPPQSDIIPPQTAPITLSLASNSTRPTSPKAVSVATLKANPPPVGEQKALKQTRHSKARNLPIKAAAREQAAVQTIAAPADIQVSGIAWQDERSGRRSVVNGFLMHEGSIVAGARITEIFPDRVRFSQAGKSFDVTLLASGLAAPAK